MYRVGYVVSFVIVFILNEMDKAKKTRFESTWTFQTARNTLFVPVTNHKDHKSAMALSIVLVSPYKSVMPGK